MQPYLQPAGGAITQEIGLIMPESFRQKVLPVTVRLWNLFSLFYFDNYRKTQIRALYPGWNFKYALWETNQKITQKKALTFPCGHGPHLGSNSNDAVIVALWF